MAQKTIPKTVRKKVERFAQRVKDQGIPISEVFVFGSYAKGTWTKHSDIDVCVLSSQFTDYFDAMHVLWHIRSEEDLPIEPIGMTQKDLAEEDSLTNEIRKYGIRMDV